MITDADGNSAISVQYYALAMVDAIELAAQPRARFTVGYEHPRSAWRSWMVKNCYYA